MAEISRLIATTALCTFLHLLQCTLTKPQFKPNVKIKYQSPHLEIDNKVHYIETDTQIRRRRQTQDSEEYEYYSDEHYEHGIHSLIR